MRPTRLQAAVAVACLAWVLAVSGDPFPPPVQVGNLLRMTNGQTRLEYDLATGRADFYWRNARKITGFYAGVGLETYITGTVYTERSWTVTNNEVTITLNRSGLPTMRQIFIFEREDSFLTRVELIGRNLQSRWMGPLVMDIPGGVDLGGYGAERALIVPFDNDSFTFSYNALPLNSTGVSYEVSAFYDNTSRYGLVVGSVTHDQWKTGVYFQGSANKLNVLNVYGGITSSNTRDVLPHGWVTGDRLASPTVFVAFGADWRAVLEAYAEANAAQTPPLRWTGGVPFGWNSWYAHTTHVSYSNAVAASAFLKEVLQPRSFHNRGRVFVNLDSYWNNLDDTQLRQLVDLCHRNGQKAGIYWTPFVYWGTAAQGSNSLMTGSSVWRWSDAFLRTPERALQAFDGGIALDPTHPGFLELAKYYLDYFKSRGFDFLKLDFLSHGSLEGVHYDPAVTTGIQAYNRGMQLLVKLNAGRMFLSAAISPIFPFQYAHSRRIYCDAPSSIADTAATLQAVTYGWWISGRLYAFSDPDLMKFSGATGNENQSRLIACAISGTVFLNSDDLSSPTGQYLAQVNLTNSAINEVARAGISFRPVEGNTGAAPADVFVRQDAGAWYVAVFNYTDSGVNKTLSLDRLGLAGSWTAVDLRNGAATLVTGPTWTVTLAPRQARLFRLGSGPVTATGPASQAACLGGSLILSTSPQGTPPFHYRWLKDGLPLAAPDDSSLVISPVEPGHAGVYTVEVSGGSGSVTNSANVTPAREPLRRAAGSGDWDSWTLGPWEDANGVPVVYADGSAVCLDDTANGHSPIRLTLSQWVAPRTLLVSNHAKDYYLGGPGGISGGAVALTKTGSGKLTLDTDNAYTGPTVISGGTLEVIHPGAVGSSAFPITVQVGGRLAGNGTLRRNVHIQPGGELAPGGARGEPGELVILGGLSLSGTTVMKVDRSGILSNDMLIVANTLTFGGTLRVTNLGPPLVLNDRFQLFNKAGGGAFERIILPPLEAGLTWTNLLTVDGTLAVVPGAGGARPRLAFSHHPNQLSLCWPPEYTGWQLQVQTNPLSAGWAGIWFDLPGSATTNSYTISTSEAEGTVLFRLAIPLSGARP